MTDETQRRYLFVAIDRATRWVFLHVYDDMTEASSTDFLARVHAAALMKITKILTDNGIQFTDRFISKDKQPSGGHAFDQACAELGIEHRLCPPRHPQTNGMVDRCNGRISELLRQTRFNSAEELEKGLLAYLLVYNAHIPQRTLGHQTPQQAIEKWRADKPDLFAKKDYNQAELDN
jgi:transposase InsO family protein